MKKNVNLCIDLKVVMQNDAHLTQGQCYQGILSRTGEDEYRFEETIRKGSPPRNPKLFDGRYVSMVRMQNGRYQMHFKTMSDTINREEFAFDVYTEITKALRILG